MMNQIQKKNEIQKIKYMKVLCVVSKANFNSK